MHVQWCCLPAGFEQPLAGSGSLGTHRTVEALKHAFALRMNLGEARRQDDLRLSNGALQLHPAVPLPAAGRVAPLPPLTAQALAAPIAACAGDPGPDPNQPFVDMSAVLSSLNDSAFISSLT